MTLVLSTAERQKIIEKAKDPKPKYYNDALGQEVEISLDFEAFIILATQTLKDSVVNWVKQNDQLATNITNRDKLLNECLTAEATDTEAKLKEIDELLKKFDKFREQFVQDEKTTQFQEVPEIGQMLSDLQFSMDELIQTRDRAKHLDVMIKVLKTILNQGLTDGKKKEMNSWAGPFTAYNG